MDPIYCRSGRQSDRYDRGCMNLSMCECSSGACLLKCAFTSVFRLFPKYELGKQ